MVYPILVGDTPKLGFHKKWQIFIFLEFLTTNVQHKVDVWSMQIVKNDVTNRKIDPVVAFQKWLKMTKNGHFFEI